MSTPTSLRTLNGFPARTAEEFVDFLNALSASGPDAPKPSPIEAFLATHPAALEFVQVAKPMPVSFAKESFFAVNAYKFMNVSGATQFGRYRILPEGGAEFFNDAAAAAQPPNYLFEEIRDRLAKGPAMLTIYVQLAGTGDIVDNSTIHWPEDRPLVEFGAIELKGEVPNNGEEQRHIIFDPIPRVDGIEPSADPLLVPRANVYLATGHRRRQNG